MQNRPDTTDLTPSERAALDALGDTFMPALGPASGDDPILFAASAAQLGVTARVLETLATIDPAKRKAFLLFLALLENPLFVAAMSGNFARFSLLSHPDRERLLTRLARSVLPPLRTAFQGARSLIMLHAYGANGSPESERVLASIGYAPAINQAASAPRVATYHGRRGAHLECDVCVIGSGAGGSVVAAELAAEGYEVIVAESGTVASGPDFDQHELTGMRALFREGGTSSTPDLSMTLFSGSCLGGGTTVNWQSCFRTPDDLRAQWDQLSRSARFSGAAFAESQDAVWHRIGAGTSESRINRNNDAICRGAEALGYRWSVIARNSRGCDLEQCGNCMFGCRVGGKQGAARTYLLDAVDAGARVVQFAAHGLIVRGGAVTAVEGFAPSESVPAVPTTISARKVVLAAGALDSPAILMRSGIRSPQLGRNLYLHPTVAVSASYPTPIDAWHGPPQTVVCDEFSNLWNGYGYRIEAVPAHTGLSSVGLPWTSARDHRREMQRVRYAAPSIVLTRDSRPGRVRLAHGGTPVFDYRLASDDARSIRHGMATAARIHFAAGAERIMTLHTTPLLWDRAGNRESIDEFAARIDAASTAPNRLPLFSAHQMGTCRMGSDPAAAVCDPQGAVFGIDGVYVADASLFPASSGVNPMVTIMTLARMVARAIIDRGGVT